MTAKEILLAVKEKFNALVAPAAPPAPAPAPPAPAAVTEYTLQDGATKISVSDLNPGGTVMIKDGTGAESPAPAGDLTLQDGTIITVAEGGVIATVTPAAPAAPAAPAPTMPAGMLSQEQLQAHWGKFAGSVSTDDLALMVKTLMEDRFGWQLKEDEQKKAIETYKENFAAKEAEVTTLKEQIEKHFLMTGEVLKLVELIAAEPTAEPDPSVTTGKKTQKAEPVTKEKFAAAIFSQSKNN